jgi:hypothetical protein
VVFSNGVLAGGNFGGAVAKRRADRVSKDVDIAIGWDGIGSREMECENPKVAL